MKKSAYQIWKEGKEKNLSDQEIKGNLINEGVIVKNNAIKITLETIKLLNRNEIAEIYAEEIKKQLPMTHYADLNKIILTKYKNSGLVYIKELAWKNINNTEL